MSRLKRLLNPKEWKKILKSLWPILAAVTCSTANAFIDHELISSILLVGYVVFMLLHLYNMIKGNHELRQFRDKITWDGLKTSSSLSQHMAMFFFIPVSPENRMVRLWRKWKKQTELRLFEGRFDARPGAPRDEDDVLHSSRQRIVVNTEQLFRMKLTGLIETQDVEKVKKFLRENKTVVSAEFFA